MKELAGLAVRQRPQQRRINDGEDRSVSADAKRQRQYDDRREPGTVPKHANGIAQISHERAHRLTSKSN